MNYLFATKIVKQDNLLKTEKMKITIPIFNSQMDLRGKNLVIRFPDFVSFN